MPFVYILKSLRNQGFYIGYTTKTVEDRLIEHNQGKFENCFSIHDRPWDIFHAIYCENVDLAKKIEQHIKNMKSRKYIHNLKEFPEIEVKLIDMYSAAD